MRNSTASSVTSTTNASASINAAYRQQSNYSVWRVQRYLKREGKGGGGVKVITLNLNKLSDLPEMYADPGFRSITPSPPPSIIVCVAEVKKLSPTHKALEDMPW
jgi:hypothetical protein